MDIALWVVQGLLALVFLMAGVMKLSQPKEKLAPQMPFVEDVSQGQVRTIGGLETLGAAGLVLPPLTGILPILSPLAALGLGLTMVGAMITHARRGDGATSLIVNAVLLILALFVAYGRFVSSPF